MKKPNAYMCEDDGQMCSQIRYSRIYNYNSHRYVKIELQLCRRRRTRTHHAYIFATLSCILRVITHRSYMELCMRLSLSQLYRHQVNVNSATLSILENLIQYIYIFKFALMLNR